MIVENVQLWTWDGKQDIYPIKQIEENQPITITEIRDWLLADENQQRIENHLNRYFECYSGRHFEWFIGQSDRAIFTPLDLLAVEALSVSVPTDAARWLLEPDEERDELLTSSHSSLAPDQNSLWTCDEKLLGDGGALQKLYALLRTKDGFGYVTTSKLLAAKFPAVVPIRDSRLETLLGLEKSSHWWAPIRSLFVAPGRSLADHLNGLKIPVEVGAITTLRRLDVILWMEAKARFPR